MFLKQEPLLKHNLPVQILGDPPPPKGDPVFELKALPDNLKFAYLDEKEIYPVIISANLIEKEDTDVTIKLFNRDTISPIGVVRDVEVLCGKIKYPTDFLFLVPHKMTFVPLSLVDLS